MKSQSQLKVYVAMSGGVDSSVAAALLKKQGYRVTGVFMKPWQPWPGLCVWQGDREDALRAASVLGIPLLTWDFSKEYKKEVGDYMIREYRAGRTPNPDVMCNKEIKFGLFLKKALKEGADFIATGHYVKIKNAKIKMQNYPDFIEDFRQGQSNSKFKSIYKLFKARDKNKDQSYFLWTLKQEQLKYCLFPIGDYIKPVVRKLAKKFDLSNHDKKDSQGVCFIGPLDTKEFLSKYIKNKKGKILDKKGNLVGEHDGVFYYTIGQRHGLDIKNGQGPYYIIGKNLKKNIIYVGSEKDLYGKETKVSNVSWVGEKPKFPTKIDAKIRYRSESVPARLIIHNSKFTIRFLKPIRAITPGQSAVFYLPRRSNKAKAGKKEEMLGGGVIV